MGLILDAPGLLFGRARGSFGLVSFGFPVTQLLISSFKPTLPITVGSFDRASILSKRILHHFRRVRAECLWTHVSNCCSATQPLISLFPPTLPIRVGSLVFASSQGSTVFRLFVDSHYPRIPKSPSNPLFFVFQDHVSSTHNSPRI